MDHWFTEYNDLGAIIGQKNKYDAFYTIFIDILTEYGYTRVCVYVPYSQKLWYQHVKWKVVNMTDHLY